MSTFEYKITVTTESLEINLFYRLTTAYRDKSGAINIDVGGYFTEVRDLSGKLLQVYGDNSSITKELVKRAI